MAINDHDNNGEIDFVEFLHLVANIEAERNTNMEGELKKSVKKTGSLKGLIFAGIQFCGKNSRGIREI